MSPIVAILASCIVTFAIGYVFERIFLRPMGSGEIERPTEYAILVTFGLAFLPSILHPGPDLGSAR